MNSREGETVPFKESVNISEESTIYKWLTRVEEMMQSSLAYELQKGVTALIVIDRTAQQEEFNAWIEKYAAQIVLLSLQVSWSSVIEDGLKQKNQKAMLAAENDIKLTLEVLAERVLHDLPGEIRKKYE